MAYLHCHNCGWEQDDFWNWKIDWKRLHKWKYRPFGYNPLSLILECITVNIWPRWENVDSWWAKEMGWKSTKKHSWFFLFRGIKIEIISLFRQKWWTWDGFIKDNEMGKVSCPCCGSYDELDID